MGSGFSGPWDAPRHSRGDARPPVHRPAGPGNPTLNGLRERYDRWDIVETDNGSLLAVPRPRDDGVSWQYVVSGWELAGFADWLAQADKAIREST